MQGREIVYVTCKMAAILSQLQWDQSKEKPNQNIGFIWLRIQTGPLGKHGTTLHTFLVMLDFPVAFYIDRKQLR